MLRCKSVFAIVVGPPTPTATSDPLVEDTSALRGDPVVDYCTDVTAQVCQTGQGVKEDE